MRHLLALALLSSPLLANGTIEVRGGHGAVALTRHAVKGVIRDQLAEVTVEQTFLSRAAGRVEGVYVFPLPPGASLAARVDGVRQIQGTLVIRAELDSSPLPKLLEIPIRFGLAGQLTVPEARARVAFEDLARAVAPARPLRVE